MSKVFLLNRNLTSSIDGLFGSIDALIDGARVRNLFGGREKFDKRKGKWGGLGIEWAAESFYQLHLQHPSAWTHEIELRPWVENW